MHPRFFAQQLIFRFNMLFIGQAAIDRANGGALRFFVKPFALGAFIGYNIIKLVGYRFVRRLGIYHISVEVFYHTFQPGTIGKMPGFAGYFAKADLHPYGRKSFLPRGGGGTSGRAPRWRFDWLLEFQRNQR